MEECDKEVNDILRNIKRKTKKKWKNISLEENKK